MIRVHSSLLSNWLSNSCNLLCLNKDILSVRFPWRKWNKKMCPFLSLKEKDSKDGNRVLFEKEWGWCWETPWQRRRGRLVKKRQLLGKQKRGINIPLFTETNHTKKTSFSLIFAKTCIRETSSDSHVTQNSHLHLYSKWTSSRFPKLLSGYTLLRWRKKRMVRHETREDEATRRRTEEMKVGINSSFLDFGSHGENLC